MHRCLSQSLAKVGKSSAGTTLEIGRVPQSRRRADWDSAVAINRLRFDMLNRMSNGADVNGG